MLPTFCHMAQLGEATFAYNYTDLSQPLNAKIPAHNTETCTQCTVKYCAITAQMWCRITSLPIGRATENNTPES